MNLPFLKQQANVLLSVFQINKGIFLVVSFLIFDFDMNLKVVILILTLIILNSKNLHSKFIHPMIFIIG